MKFILLTLLTSLVAQSYTPSVESLFRNGENINIENASVVGNLVVKRKPQELKKDNLIKEVPDSFAYKFMFLNENKRATQFAQVSYTSSVISKKNMASVHYIPSLSFSNLRLTSEDIDKKLFYSLLNSLMNNQGDLMIDFLQSIGLNVLKNKDSVNREQIYLISRYINFLKKKKEDPDTDIENPLEPESEDAREKVSEIMSQAFLDRSPFVKREKNDHKLYWVISSDKVRIKFDGQKHRLISMNIKTDYGTIDVECFNYILFSQLSFPELIHFKSLDGSEYEIKMKDLRMRSDTSESFMKVINGFKRDLQDLAPSERLGKPSFTL